MNYSEAAIVKKNNEKLIGTSISDCIIDDIIILPTKEDSKSKFFLNYCYHHNSKTALMPFIDEDLQVFAICSKYLFEKNLLVYKEITE